LKIECRELHGLGLELQIPDLGQAGAQTPRGRPGHHLAEGLEFPFQERLDVLAVRDVLVVLDVVAVGPFDREDFGAVAEGALSFFRRVSLGVRASSTVCSPASFFTRTVNLMDGPSPMPPSDGERGNSFWAAVSPRRRRTCPGLLSFAPALRARGWVRSNRTAALWRGGEGEGFFVGLGDSWRAGRARRFARRRR